jgi:C4-dicarboxylate-specific signal transduction histidine kinase
VALRDADGKVLKFVGTTTDIDDQKRAEEALRQTQAELAHATRVTTMGELAASIAHEVNQPIAGVVINGNACLRWLSRINEDSVNLNEAREGIQRIIRDGNRAGEIVERIRALFKKAEPAKEPLDLNEAIREILLLAKSEMSKQRILLRLELGDDLPPTLGDKVQLQQVILNLVLNGIDAMNHVEDRSRDLIIRTQRVDQGVVMATIQDSGVGLDSSSMERVFAPFHTTKPGGLGMGLSISRSIIENHQGQLWVTANEGPGASFHFTLPAVAHGESLRAQSESASQT